MKKVLAFTFAILLVISLPIGASAASNKYGLTELDLTVEFPSQYSIITKGTPSNDPIFSKLGTTYASLMSYYKENSIYLNAVHSDLGEEIVVTMVENVITDFNLYSDASVSALMSVLVSEYKNYGIIVSNYEIYQHTQAKFVKIYFTDTAQTVHAVQYYTVYNNKAINFTMRSYKGYLSASQEQTIKGIVDSIHFNTDPQNAETTPETQSFVYTDSKTNVSFTVPKNWKEDAFSKDREYLDVKFVPNDENGSVILYGSNDLWSQMSSSERQGYVRADINNSQFTNADIAEMLGTSSYNVKKVVYNNTECFQSEVTTTTNVSGYDLSVTMTHVLYFDNGWMYSFQFGGTTRDKEFSDFTSLLNTVTFPKTIGNTTSNNSTSNASNSNDAVVVVIVWMVLIAFVVLIIVVTKNKKKASTVSTEALKEQPPEEKVLDNRYVYCHMCGTQVPFDSEFCHRCGTKILQ